MSESNGDISLGGFRIQPLRADNWLPWKLRMQAILLETGLSSHIEGDGGRPTFAEADKPKPTEIEALTKWKQADAKAMGRILLAVSDSEIVYVSGALTALEMWTNLASMKESKGPLGLLAKRREFYRAEAEEGFIMTEHIARLRKLQEELFVMGQKTEDADFVMILVTSLPASWDAFTSSFLGSANNRTSMIKSQELAGILIAEQARKAEKETGNSSTALQVRGGSGSQGGRTCHNCGKEGHFKRDCWAKGGGKEGEGPQGKVQMTRENEPTSLNFAYLAAVDKEIEPNLEWVLDTAANSHISPRRSSFADYESFNNATISGIGEGRVPVLGRGTAQVDLEVEGRVVRHTLRDVLHVPSVPHGLLSAIRLDEGGGRIEIEGQKVVMKMKGVTVGIARVDSRRLYLLKTAHASSTHARTTTRIGTVKRKELADKWFSKASLMDNDEYVEIPGLSREGEYEDSPLGQTTYDMDFKVKEHESEEGFLETAPQEFEEDPRQMEQETNSADEETEVAKLIGLRRSTRDGTVKNTATSEETSRLKAQKKAAKKSQDKSTIEQENNHVSEELGHAFMVGHLMFGDATADVKADLGGGVILDSGATDRSTKEEMQRDSMQRQGDMANDIARDKIKIKPLSTRDPSSFAVSGRATSVDHTLTVTDNCARLWDSDPGISY